MRRREFLTRAAAAIAIGPFAVKASLPPFDPMGGTFNLPAPTKGFSVKDLQAAADMLRVQPDAQGTYWAYANPEASRLWSESIMEELRGSLGHLAKFRQFTDG